VSGARTAVLVTGATGFVGGALVPALLAAGHRVRCLVRTPVGLEAPWRDDVEVVAGTVEDRRDVTRAAAGTTVAYYLVHAMSAGRGEGLLVRERRAAAAFRDAVAVTDVGRVVYLGGLVDEDRLIHASEHLYARHETGQELRLGPVPVTELRAGIVVGAGSASFELVRAAARWPVAPAVPLASSRTQPVALGDLLAVLVAALDAPDLHGRVLELGGPEVVTYGELVALVRRASNRRAPVRLPLPHLPAELAAPALAAMARLDPALVLALLPSAHHDAVVRDTTGRARFADELATSLDEAIASALKRR
jgi:uncharacterized protein YbjT (DUF2867 family)